MKRKTRKALQFLRLLDLLKTINKQILPLRLQIKKRKPNTNSSIFRENILGSHRETLENEGMLTKQDKLSNDQNKELSAYVS